MASEFPTVPIRMPGETGAIPVDSAVPSPPPSPAARPDVARAHLPAAPVPAPISAPRRPRRRGRVGCLIAVAGLLLVAGLALLLVETLGRSMAEREISQRVSANLGPDASGSFDSRIDGFFLPQLLTKKFDRIELTSRDFRVKNQPVDIRATVRGTYLANDPIIDGLEGTAELSPEAVNHLITLPDAKGGLSFGRNLVEYSTSVRVLQQDIRVHVTAEPLLVSDTLLLTAKNARVADQGISVDLTAILDRVGHASYPICMAQFLPRGVRVSALDLAPDKETVKFSAGPMAIDDQALASKGSCTS